MILECGFKFKGDVFVNMIKEENFNINEILVFELENENVNSILVNKNICEENIEES